LGDERRVKPALWSLAPIDSAIDVVPTPTEPSLAVATIPAIAPPIRWQIGEDAEPENNYINMKMITPLF
jgi:hypothetical protein